MYLPSNIKKYIGLREAWMRKSFEHEVGLIMYAYDSSKEWKERDLFAATLIACH